MEIIKAILAIASFVFHIIIIVELFKSFKRIKELKEQHQKDHYTLEHLSIKQDKANREILNRLAELEKISKNSKI